MDWEYENPRKPVKRVKSSRLDPNPVDSVVFGAGIVQRPDGKLQVYYGANDGAWKEVSESHGKHEYVSKWSAVSGNSCPIKVTVSFSGKESQSDRDMTTLGSFVRFGAREMRTGTSNGNECSGDDTQVKTFFQKHAVSVSSHVESPSHNAFELTMKEQVDRGRSRT